MERDNFPEEHRALFDRIEGFCRMNDAWKAKDLRAYLWHKPAAGISEFDAKYARKYFDVNYSKIPSILCWLRCWGWTVKRKKGSTYSLTPPEGYQLTPPFLFERRPRSAKGRVELPTKIHT